MRKTVLSFFLLLPAAAESYAQTLPQVDLEAENEVVAKVNTQSVSTREVERIFVDSVSLLEQRIAQRKLKPEERPGELQKAWENAVQQAIQDALLDQEAVRLRERIIHNFVARSAPDTPPSRMLERFKRLESDAIEELRREKIRAAGGEVELNAALRRSGQTRDNWEQDLRKELFRREALYLNLGFVTVRPGQIKNYYQENIDEYTQKEVWRLRRIRVPIDKFSDEEAAAKAAALIHEKLQEGFGFAKLAAALDYEPEFAKYGGQLVLNGKPDLPSGAFPEEEKIARNLKDGEYSTPVKTSDAYLLVLREYRQEEKTTSFAEVSDSIHSRLFAQEVANKKAQFFERQKKNAFIEIYRQHPPKRWMQ